MFVFLFLDFNSLLIALLSCHKRVQSLESEAVLGRFRGVYEKINLALDGMPYSEMGISDEVKEQV